MPIKIPNDLPAHGILSRENIFIMQESRAMTQDIRPLRLAILNLMPKKIETETQLLRLLGNTPLQLELELLQTASHTSRNTSAEHLFQFYKTFDEVRDQKFDGVIITGAPVEQIPFEEVDYWPELCEIMDWCRTNAHSTYYICWGAQAGLYHHYGIPKYQLKEKMFGVFPHTLTDAGHHLVYGFDELFYAPHSRHTEVRAEDILACPELILLSTSPQAGVYITASRTGREFFVTGHSEYDRDTLAQEYYRDRDAGLPIRLPCNYFPDDDDTKAPVIRWSAHAQLLLQNWLNYFVYQSTPYNLEEIRGSIE